jgi:hypothetical protein
VTENELAMPPQNRVWCHDGGHVEEPAPSESVSNGPEASPFTVTQLEPPTVQLRLQRPVFLLQERDDVLLFPPQPGAQAGDEMVERNHARILRQRRSIEFLGHNGRGSRVHRLELLDRVWSAP